MVLGLNPARPIRYVLLADRGSEKPTVWILRLLPPDLQAQFVDETTGYPKDLHRAFVRVLRAGLRGWEDFPVEGDGGPTEAVFALDSNDQPTNACLQMIPPQYRGELAGAILAAGKIEPDEKKGSS